MPLAIPETLPRERRFADRLGVRFLPPAHSPLSLRALARAPGAVLGHDPRSDLAQWLRVEYEAHEVLLLDSGTHALDLGLRVALAAMGGPPVVALPAYACYDVATAAVGAGARITLYDVDPGSLAPDLASFRRALAQGARVVVVAPLYGIPVDSSAIEACAREFDAFVIEDAAQGNGGNSRGRPLGSHAQLSVLSFGRGKGWTGGCGGALLAKGRATDWLNALAEHRPQTPGGLGTIVRAAAQWTLGRPELYALPASLPWLHLGETHYKAPTPPREMPRVAAAVLQGSRVLATREAAIRRANGASLRASIGSIPHARLVVPFPGAISGHLRFPVRVPRGLGGFSDLRRATRLGIAPGYPTTLARLPEVLQRMPDATASMEWPGAEEIVRTLITLPTHSLVTNAERAEMLDLLGDYAP